MISENEREIDPESTVWISIKTSSLTVQRGGGRPWWSRRRRLEMADEMLFCLWLAVWRVCDLFFYATLHEEVLENVLQPARPVRFWTSVVAVSDLSMGAGYLLALPIVSRTPRHALVRLAGDARDARVHPVAPPEARPRWQRSLRLPRRHRTAHVRCARRPRLCRMRARRSRTCAA